MQGIKLRQAAQQQLFNKALEDAENKLDEIEKAVSSDDLGKDLRSVKDLLHKHQVRGKFHLSCRVIRRRYMCFSLTANHLFPKMKNLTSHQENGMSFLQKKSFRETSEEIQCGFWKK